MKGNGTPWYHLDLENVLLATLVVAIAMLLNVVMRVRSASKGRPRRSLPPGPRPWPVVGNMGLLGSRLQRDLAKLAQQYGNIVFLRLGSVPAVVVSSPELAEEAMKTQDPMFASRPSMAQADIMMFERSGIAFTPFGNYWRYARRVLTQEVLTSKFVLQFQAARKEDILSTLFYAIEKSRGGTAVRIEHAFDLLVTNSITRMMISKTLCSFERGDEDPEMSLKSKFIKNLKEMMRLFTVPDIGDYIPFLGKFDLQGYQKEMVQVRELNNAFLEPIIEDHRTQTADDSRKKDFVDVLLSCSQDEHGEGLSSNQIKGILLDTFLGGTETVSGTLLWTLSELVKNPATLRRAQAELDAVVGGARPVEESDIPQLEYLHAVTKEVFRLHPVVPVIPRLTESDCELGGYHIPAKSRVLINCAYMGRDPAVWPDATLEFRPERFLDNPISLDGQQFKLLPFGAGRRICPGKGYAMLALHHTLAALLHCCDWTLPEGQSPGTLDMEGGPGMTNTRAVPLEVVATPRMNLEAVYRRAYEKTCGKP